MTTQAVLAVERLASRIAAARAVRSNAELDAIAADVDDVARCVFDDEQGSQRAQDRSARVASATARVVIISRVRALAARSVLRGKFDTAALADAYALAISDACVAIEAAHDTAFSARPAELAAIRTVTDAIVVDE
jgi:hypothetical protein